MINNHLKFTLSRIYTIAKVLPLLDWMVGQLNVVYELLLASFSALRRDTVFHWQIQLYAGLQGTFPRLSFITRRNGAASLCRHQEEEMLLLSLLLLLRLHSVAMLDDGSRGLLSC